jgi:DNA-binding transcriptional regulator YhcF (GntR family)
VTTPAIEEDAGTAGVFEAEERWLPLLRLAWGHAYVIGLDVAADPVWRAWPRDAASEPEYMTAREVRAAFGVSSPTSLRRWEQKGILHPVRLPNRYRRYSRSEVSALLGAGQRQGPGGMLTARTPEELNAVIRADCASSGHGYGFIPGGQPSARGPRKHDLVAGALAGRIASGELKAGSLIPPKRDLARDMEAGTTTVERAFAKLVREGLIRLVPGNRYQVCATEREGGPSPQEAARERLLEALRWMWDRADGAYKISTTDDGTLEAWRMDGSGTLHADTPEELRDAIREDYGLRPVKTL